MKVRQRLGSAIWQPKGEGGREATVVVREPTCGRQNYALGAQRIADAIAKSVKAGR